MTMPTKWKKWVLKPLALFLYVSGFFILLGPLFLQNLLTSGPWASKLPTEIYLLFYDFARISFDQLKWGLNLALAGGLIGLLGGGFGNRKAVSGFALLGIVLLWIALTPLVQTRYQKINYKELVFENKPPTNFEDLFEVEKIKNSSPQDFGELSQMFKRQYNSQKDFLRKEWSQTSEDMRKIYYYMNAANLLYQAGNNKAIGQMGCVISNENLNKKPLSEPIAAKTYASSVIGCCSDFKLVLEKVLLSEGFTLRTLDFEKKHVALEVKVDDQILVVDPTINLIFYDSWQELINRKAGALVKATSFPLKSFYAPRRKEGYRPELNFLKMLVIDWAMNRHDVGLVSEWKKN